MVCVAMDVTDMMAAATIQASMAKSGESAGGKPSSSSSFPRDRLPKRDTTRCQQQLTGQRPHSFYVHGVSCIYGPRSKAASLTWSTEP